MGRAGRPERGRREAPAPTTAGRTARASPAIQSGLQLEAIWSQALLRRLRSRCPQRLALRITDNVHTMLSFRRRDGLLEVRLHHMFLVAPDPVVASLAAYIRGSEPRASEVLDRFILRHRWLIRRVPPHVRRSRVPIRSRGRHHDLAALFDGLNRELLGGKVDCEITWGAAPRVKLPRKSIKLGSYSADSRLIRIHPALDQAHVPGYFVRWIVFHEMLHHLHGITRKGGRRCVHSPGFCADEQRYPALERSRAWERENLDGLLAWEPEAEAGEDVAQLRVAAGGRR
ncbi:hypothetical protein [Vulgatibacter incomptus]|uniref:SprT-like domain-containing protein n=1 Tax=Vulgatibacter incomptus TaxID=1391653 RepID=A0A0K1P984_9BACT|nr:hypothetical protein [Vulgatibacter incomptus]AKU90080.1 hypothetical protein AKJ08_0467 [Vulgatibacter incomptus]